MRRTYQFTVASVTNHPFLSKGNTFSGEILMDPEEAWKVTCRTAPALATLAWPGLPGDTVTPYAGYWSEDWTPYGREFFLSFRHHGYLLQMVIRQDSISSEWGMIGTGGGLRAAGGAMIRE